MKELAIGQIGVIDGVRVECCECEIADCSECVFFEDWRGCGIADIDVPCSWNERSDHTDVYFKKIEKEKRNGNKE